MKNAFIKTVASLMRKDKKMILLVADMGFSMFEEMQIEFPDRFINTGVTEQGTISFAAGLALSGHKVFVFAQAIFMSTRCFEQIRLDIAYNNLDVKIIGANAGFSLNQLGVSHFALEDVALMQTLPGMTIFTPGDPEEMEWALNKSYEIVGPTYLRYSKLGNVKIHSSKINPPLGVSIQLTSGNDATLVVSGGIIEIAIKVVKKLVEQDINISLFTLPTIKPVDHISIIKILKNSKHIFTLEEHNVIGGLGSVMSGIIAENEVKSRLTRLGSPDVFTSVGGSLDYLLDLNNLSVERLLKKITDTINLDKHQ